MFNEHLLVQKHLITLSTTVALLPRKQQCFCLTCLGPTAPHCSVFIQSLRGKEWRLMGSALIHRYHTHACHTHWQQHWWKSLRRRPQHRFTRHRGFREAVCVFPKTTLQLQPLHYSAKFPEGASVDAWWQMKPERKDWGWSKTTTTTAWFFKPHIPAAVRDHPQRKTKKTKKTRPRFLHAAVVITRVHLPLSRADVWTQSSTKFSTWLN